MTVSHNGNYPHNESFDRELHRIILLTYKIQIPSNLKNIKLKQQTFEFQHLLISRAHHTRFLV